MDKRHCNFQVAEWWAGEAGVLELCQEEGEWVPQWFQGGEVESHLKKDKKAMLMDPSLICCLSDICQHSGQEGTFYFFKVKFTCSQYLQNNIIEESVFISLNSCVDSIRPSNTVLTAGFKSFTYRLFQFSQYLFYRNKTI